jgi:Undecaprenyl-phosphate galactose phosphotransferase WbaP
MHNDAPSILSGSSSVAIDGMKAGNKSRSVNLWVAAGDVLALVTAWLVALALLWMVEDDSWRAGLIGWWSALGRGRILLICGLVATMFVLFALRGHYSRRRPFSSEVLDVIKVFLVLAVLDAVVSYLTRWQFSRSWFVVAWVLALLFIPLTRAAVKVLLLKAGKWQRPTLIVGAGPNAIEAAAAFRSEPLMGLQVIAFLALPGESGAPDAIDHGGRRVPVIPLDQDPNATLAKYGSPQITIALDAENLIPHQGLVQQICARHTDVSIVPPLRGLPLYGMEITHFFSHEVLMLSVRNNLARPGAQFIKRVFDLVASVALLVLLSPLFAYLSWRIRQSGGDAIFGHVRVGQHGKLFRCFKFRTMVPDADKVLADLLANDPQARAEWECDFKLKNDPRITRIGAFLRATSLDELPQLWNVVRGEMSLVGPRPVVEEELQRYGEQVGYYLEAPPGITGLWQISGRNDISYDDRVALDCWYVRNWSLWYDLVVLVKTIWVVLRKDGAY